MTSVHPLDVPKTLIRDAGDCYDKPGSLQILIRKVKQVMGSGLNSAQ